MAESKKISLKLVIDKKHNRVVLAESDKDFVDILLSFLTMPIGTICRLLNKDSSIGCIANLYESIENLDDEHFQTKACKAMLLHPLNASDGHCENLVVNIDDTEPRRFFTCEESDCCSKATCYYSSVPSVQCCCGKLMTYHGMWQKRVSNEHVDGVFVKGGLKFVVTDDLHIMPASTSVLLSLLGKLVGNDRSALEERILDLGHEEILTLLRSSLASDNPLTNLCFDSSATNDIRVAPDTNCTFRLIPKSECYRDYKGKGIKVKLLVTKNDNKVMHAEGGEEMVNFVFSFLTLPLGSVIKMLDKKTSLGCVDNLYNSVESLCLEGNDCIKSENCKMMLLHPKLKRFFSCKNQLLIIDEMASVRRGVRGCFCCFKFRAAKCSHGVQTASFIELNPKLSNNATEPGGGFARGPGKFILTDDLHASPMSPVSALHIFNKLEVDISDLVEEEISIGETQALNLLKAALVSKTALSNVFSNNINKRRRVDIA